MPICSKNMSFDECELAILRSAVDKMNHIRSKTLLSKGRNNEKFYN